jgi:hypothetical protein
MWTFNSRSDSTPLNGESINVRPQDSEELCHCLRGGPCRLTLRADASGYSSVCLMHVWYRNEAVESEGTTRSENLWCMDLGVV